VIKPSRKPTHQRRHRYLATAFEPCGQKLRHVFRHRSISIAPQAAEAGEPTCACTCGKYSNTAAVIRWQTGYSTGMNYPGFATRHVNADRLPPGVLPSPEPAAKPATRRRRRLSQSGRGGWSFLGRCTSLVAPLSGCIKGQAPTARRRRRIATRHNSQPQSADSQGLDACARGREYSRRTRTADQSHGRPDGRRSPCAGSGGACG